MIWGEVTEKEVQELRDWVLSSCDSLTVALYLMGEGRNEEAAQMIEESIGNIEVSMAVFINGGLDS